METISLDRTELTAWASQSLAFYGLDISNITTCLLAQLYACQINRIFDIFNITDAIKELEGLKPLAITGETGEFRHPPLIGFKKKHFYSPRFIVKNLHNFLRSKDGKRFFSSAFQEAISISEKTKSDELALNYIVDQVTVRAYLKKCKNNNITGEWIVFKNHDNINHFITIAFHEENNDEIYEKIKSACTFDKKEFLL